MYASDFSSQSTHQLLFQLFGSEIGLLPVSHPEVQLNALALNFSSIQTELVRGLRAGDTHFGLQLRTSEGPELAPVDVAYRADAALFQELYGKLPQFSGDRRLTQHVYPLIGSMILSLRPLREHTLTLLRDHIQRYNPAVGRRMCEQLLKFDLAPLVPSLPRPVD